MQTETYENRVEEFARNGLRMGEKPRTIAQGCIVRITRTGGEQTMHHTVASYIDDGPSTTRLYPKDVITGTVRDWSHENYPGPALRPLAVSILRADIKAAYARTVSDGVADMALEAEEEVVAKAREMLDEAGDEEGH